MNCRRFVPAMTFLMAIGVMAIVTIPTAQAKPTKPSGYASMKTPPGWKAKNLTFSDSFQNLNNWNYGLTNQVFQNNYPSCPVEGQTGTPPYVGSDLSPSGQEGDYDMPGNVSQTSTGVNKSLLSTYTPQTFNSTGWGVTLTAHYTGTKTYSTCNEGNETRNWTSGMINTNGKVDFPTGANEEAYVQVKMKQMGRGNSNNGVWNSLWFLGQTATNYNESEFDLQETGIGGPYEANGQSLQPPDYVFSHNWPNGVGGSGEQVDNYDTNDNLSAGYHIYGVDLNEYNNTVTVYFDNVAIGSVALDDPAPWFLIMDGAICGSRCDAPASNGNMSMKVMQVEVFQRKK